MLGFAEIKENLATMEKQVDQYSGYFIKYIEFDTRKAMTNKVLKALVEILSEKKMPDFLILSPAKRHYVRETVMMQNVIASMGNYMGLSIEPYVLDIVKDATSILNKHALEKDRQEKDGCLYKEI